MELVRFKSITFSSLKRKYCVFMSKIILRIYQPFRECTGVNKSTDNKIKEYKENEKQVQKVKKVMPIIKDNIDELMDNNKKLNSSLGVCIDDLEVVYNHLLNNDINSAIKLLNEYPFSKKIKG